MMVAMTTTATLADFVANYAPNTVTTPAVVADPGLVGCAIDALAMFANRVDSPYLDYLYDGVIGGHWATLTPAHSRAVLRLLDDHIRDAVLADERALR